MNLKNILHEFIPEKQNKEVSVVDILILLICNLTIGKYPLYELEEWVEKIDLGVVGLEKQKEQKFTDDRFGRALDELFAVDRASLMTRIVIEAISKFNIKLDQIHNDSTTIKAFGEYHNKSRSGLELKKGLSKDHRPDLKQLVYSLTISSDGAVPIHHKVYSGNRNDDTTHIDTWTTLSKICSRKDFLYVADCKLCTDRQLSYIVENGGKAVTVVPENWKEVGDFKENLRNKKPKKKEILRRQNEDGDIIYYYAFDGEYRTQHRGFKIHWIYSTDAAKEDFEKRERLLTKAENDLRSLLSRINKRNLKTEESIRKKCESIINKRYAKRFIEIEINKTVVKYVRKLRIKGKCKEVESLKEEYTLSWKRNKRALKMEENVDGVFPLLSTDATIPAKEALEAFKYQPKLEKRFSQFKSVHNAAPLFFKKIERIEANMFLFFISLMIQSLIEREVREKMAKHRIEYLTVYPEDREAIHPTTNKVFDRFSTISTYELMESNGDRIEYYQDELSELHLKILYLLGIEENKYWEGTATAHKVEVNVPV